MCMVENAGESMVNDVAVRIESFLNPLCTIDVWQILPLFWLLLPLYIEVCFIKKYSVMASWPYNSLLLVFIISEVRLCPPFVSKHRRWIPAGNAPWLLKDYYHIPQLVSLYKLLDNSHPLPLMVTWRFVEFPPWICVSNLSYWV